LSESLTKRTVRGVAWTLPTTLASRIVGLVGTLLIARYLVPEEYGEVMAASIVTITAFGISTLGVGIYLLSHRELTRAESFHATVWFMATGVVALGGVWALSVPLGHWFDAPEMDAYMPALVGSALLDRVVFLPERMLIRNLSFRWLSIARALGELAFTGVSLATAIGGHGAWAIVYGFAARAILRALLIVPAVGWREWLEPHPLVRDTFKKIISFGVTISVAGIGTFLMRRWDNLLVSAFYGNAVMGAYNYAYNLADTPAVAIGEQMSDVVAASFPHAEGEKRQAALVRACTMVSLIMFPLAFGLGAVGETVVAAFFDAKWASVGTMLVLLAILSVPRPLAHIIHAYFMACHRPRVVLIQEWVSLGILMAAIASLGQIDIRWTCVAVGLSFVLRTLILMWLVRRIDGIPLRRFLPLVRPLIASSLMVLAIVALRPVLSDFAPMVRLAIEVTIGAVVYLVGALVIFRAQARELLHLVRSAR
jgi:PST family polysaccharide transporter